MATDAQNRLPAALAPQATPATRTAYRAELDRLAAALFKLGREADARPETADLGCIYRGMAEDITRQAGVLLATPAPAQAPARVARDRLEAALRDASTLAGLMQARARAVPAACAGAPSQARAAMLSGADGRHPDSAARP